MSATKLLNLQGIRGIAIIAVLGFHFFPNYFPNGYLGVDQFFVLSGFLMCMLLTKNEKLPKFEMISNFYIRRFKRILPLYQLIIFISLIALYLIFPDTTIEININSAKRAIIFISNQLKTLEDDYFEKLNMAIDIFTHTWSLSVEIQFYLIVPFLFLLPFRIISLTIISIISLFYFYILPSDIAFLNVFARIWQFLIGMIAFIIHQNISTDKYQSVKNSDECEKQQLLSEDEKHESEEKEIETELLKIEATKISEIIIRMVIIKMIIALFFPKSIMEIVARPSITLITGIILIFSKGDDILLSNKILTYIGDISYSLYLIHWPISSYCKITGMPHHNCITVFLFVSLILSILIYHSFEKWYTKQSNIIVFIISIILLSLNLGILYHELLIPKEYEGSIENMKKIIGNGTLEDSNRLNRKWTLDDLKNLEFQCDKIFGWCSYTGLNPNNTLRIMSFGNSWADNHAKLMYEECGSKVREFMKGSISGCEPIYKFPTQFKQCPEFLEEVVHHLDEYKPDYAFYLTRAINIGTNYTDDFKNDPIYQSILNETRHLVDKIKYKLFIVNSIPSVNITKIASLSDDIKNNIPRDEIDRKLMIYYEEHMNARKRYAQLEKDCGSKCEIFDYFDLFHPNGTETFRYYDDNGFSYMTGLAHFSPYGLEYLRPFWRDFCNKKLV